MPEAPKTGTRLDDLAIDEVSGVDRPAHAQDGWMVLKSRAAQLDLAPEDLAEILDTALEIARDEGYDFQAAEDEIDEEADDETTDEVTDEGPDEVTDVTDEVTDESTEVAKAGGKPFPSARPPFKAGGGRRKKKAPPSPPVDAEDLADGGADEAEEDAAGKPFAGARPPFKKKGAVAKSADELAIELDEVLKSLDPAARSLVIKAQSDAQVASEVAKAATIELKAARDAHADREAVLKAREDWTFIPGLDPITFGPMIRKARDVDPTFADAVSQLLTSASAALAESSLFTASGSPTASSGLSELDAAVLKARETHPGMSKAQLIATAVMSNPDLYDSYRASQNGG
jgi:hypothetical protein